jgi:CheY-like chemotaxis protein
MKEAKIFIAQDDEGTLRLLGKFIAASNHSVVATASTLEQADKVIPTFVQLGVQVAVLDANLTEDDSSGMDGQIMTGMIRTLFPDVKIVGLSGRRFPVPVDVDLGAINMRDLIKVIDKL